jgi:hypothetical protein
MKKYLKRLMVHPGTPIAATLTPSLILFALLARAKCLDVDGLMAGVVASIMIWSVVLWTARTQPLPEDSTQGDQYEGVEK